MCNSGLCYFPISLFFLDNQPESTVDWSLVLTKLTGFSVHYQNLGGPPTFQSVKVLIHPSTAPAVPLCCIIHSKNEFVKITQSFVI